MDTNKILSANLLDLLFEDRNKDYGAYELRNTYQKRIIKALAITLALAALLFAGSVLAKTMKPQNEGRIKQTIVEIQDLKLDEKKPEPIPEPERRPEPEIRREQFTAPILTDEDVEQTLPPQEDLTNAIIDTRTVDGQDATGIVNENSVDKSGTGIIESRVIDEPDIYVDVQVQAKFIGDWTRFLVRNLNGNVPVDNGAPAGRHTVRIQFVVDKEGNVSEIKPLTSVGFGMEEEAMRVIRKATRWEPAIQSGYKVKAYRIQPITFEVSEE